MIALGEDMACKTGLGFPKGVRIMMQIHKKFVIDEQGNPQEVIIPWNEFQEIAEILGLDLDDDAIEDLHHARQDREKGNEEAFVDLEAL